MLITTMIVKIRVIPFSHVTRGNECCFYKCILGGGGSQKIEMQLGVTSALQIDSYCCKRQVIILFMAESGCS